MRRCELINIEMTKDRVDHKPVPERPVIVTREVTPEFKKKMATSMVFSISKNIFRQFRTYNINNMKQALPSEQTHKVTRKSCKIITENNCIALPC